jgi:hypothetical protein
VEDRSDVLRGHALAQVALLRELCGATWPTSLGRCRCRSAAPGACGQPTIAWSAALGPTRIA